MDNSKILNDKRKQSSITTASMSLCVSPEAIELTMELMNAYDKYLKDNNETNSYLLAKAMQELVLRITIMRSEEQLRRIKQSEIPKNGTIDDIIYSFFPQMERLKKS